MKMLIILLCLSCFWWGLPLHADNHQSSASQRAANALSALGLKGEQNIEYKYSEENRTSLDIIYPKRTIYEKAPLLIFFHGGGYVNGSKDSIYSRKHVVRAVTEAGIAVASINYRLVKRDNNIRMNQVNVDCKDALRFLALNADRFGIDRHKFITWGSSAGGSLALITAITPPDYLPGEVSGDDIDHTVIGSVVYFGAVSFFEETGVWEGRRQPINPLLFEGYSGLSPDEIRALTSPDRHFTSDAPPLLLFYGDKDHVVPVENGRLLNALALEKGVEVSYFEVKNADHSLNPVGGDVSLTWPEIKQLTAEHVLRWASQ